MALLDDPTLRDAYLALTRAGFAVYPPKTSGGELVPMVERDKFNIPAGAQANIFFSDPNHFRRTVKFARDNNLLVPFAEQWVYLCELLTGTRCAEKPKVYESQTYTEYEPAQTRVYPDGYRDPGFGWQGAGMVGGLVFHPSSRDWSVHT